MSQRLSQAIGTPRLAAMLLTFFGTVAILLATRVKWGAAYLPARRAARVSPSIALRYG